jgi:GxxExxY protein
MDINDLTYKIIGCAYKTHSALGPGLLESSYKEVLYYLMAKEGLLVDKEVALPLIHEDVKLEVGYRLDLFVEKTILVEIKAVEAIIDVHLAQILTYMKLANCKVGLLINFNVADLKKGIKRMVL